jgi:hypothetical protein
VAFILTRRFDEAGPHDLTGFATYRLTGLTQQDVAELLGVRYSTGVVNVLTRETGGNPLAVLESARTLTLAASGCRATTDAGVPTDSRLYELELSRPRPAPRSLYDAAASFDPAVGWWSAPSPMRDSMPRPAWTRHQPCHQRDKPGSGILAAFSRALRRPAERRGQRSIVDRAGGSCAYLAPSGGCARLRPHLARELAASANAAHTARLCRRFSRIRQAARMLADGAEAGGYLAAAVGTPSAGDGARARRLAQQVLTQAAESEPREVLVVSACWAAHRHFRSGEESVASGRRDRPRPAVDPCAHRAGECVLPA